jgi:hypothetical protein
MIARLWLWFIRQEGPNEGPKLDVRRYVGQTHAALRVKPTCSIKPALIGDL